MINKTAKIILLTLFYFFTLPLSTYASDPATIQDLEVVFSTFISGALTLAGIAVLVMLIVGGFGFLTAGGDKEGAAKAQKTITYAIGGLVLVLSAWIILNLLSKFLGVDFSTFKICLDATC